MAPTEGLLSRPAGMTRCRTRSSVFADAGLDRSRAQTSAHRFQFSGHPSTPDISSLSSSASPRGTPMRAFRRADMTNC